jgi:mannose-1-phosphate guanylyltransferase
MFDHYYAVIMAGGGGTRLWPLSRKAKPKQMLRLLDERSLFQTAIDRLDGIFPPERILVVTVEDQASELLEQCPAIPEENFLLEPMPRGTASVVGLAAIVLQKRDPEAVMAILTSDHIIGNEEGFRHLLLSAYEIAQEGHLVTLGIKPTFPATGYGYIHRGNKLGLYRGLEVYEAIRFIEKPDQDRARVMLAEGDYAWNSGMFVWRVDKILGEFETQIPALFTSLSEIGSALGTSRESETIYYQWSHIEPETIDYGIMEGANQVAVIPAVGLDWSDVGSWDSLFDVIKGDQEGNIVMGGKHIGLETSNSLVYMTQEHRLIVTIGVEDLVVVDTGDVLLVCHKEQAQEVRKIVNQLKDNGGDFV